MMHMIKIEYGIVGNLVDVTSIALLKLTKNSIIFIPKDDNLRAKYFKDHLFGVLKTVFVTTNYTGEPITVECEHLTDVYIDIQMKKIYMNDAPKEMKQLHTSKQEILANIHSRYRLNYGSFQHEYPEQLMAVTYLTGNEKVLEIGANIGRNSIVIADILRKANANNFVTLECDPNIAKQLMYNRDVNNISFIIENSALSKRKLIQKGWDTIASDVVLDGYTPVKTITWDELNAKYNILFDTLVLDCEGAFYYILMDMPEILTNIKLIIMENDYHDITHKKYIDGVLKEHGFYVDYSESGGWGPCYNNFFEVWKK
jgi:FkbM family methyltransferase